MKAFVKTTLSIILILALSLNFAIIHKLIGKVEELTNEVDNLREDTDGEMDLVIDDFQHEISILESLLCTTHEKIIVLEESFGEDLEKSEADVIKTLNSTKTDLQAEIHNIKNLLGDSSIKISDMEAIINSLEISIDTLNFTLETLIIQVNENQMDIATLTDKISDLEREIENLSSKSYPSAINNDDLTLTGTANRTENGTVTIGNGANNKAILSGDFQSNHFSMYAKFEISSNSDFSFVMGKGSSYYGFWAELINDGEKSYLNIYKDLLGDLSREPNISNELDFKLVPGEKYVLKMTFDTLTEQNPQKLMTIEILGTNNEYYAYSTNCNAYGAPFYYSNSNECIVEDFRLSIQHYYDLENAKVVVFGHSFVEADSIGAYRSQAFTYLLEREIGIGKVLNFGLGGDSLSTMSSKISNSEKFIKNCDYALLCIGTNDRGLDYETYIKRLQECIDKTETMGITPILFTIPHANYIMTNDMLEINDWIRKSGYHYVDMYEVFANKDGSCKEDLFLGDKVHPSVEGHKYIFNRIKMDCPFLF